MEVEVNGMVKVLDAGMTVRDLVVHLGFPRDGVAVAVNRAVVPRGEQQTHTLAPGDHVEIIQAVGGG